MNPIKVLEWKGMYPIKKILLVMIWLFGCFLCVAGIIIFISLHTKILLLLLNTNNHHFF